MDWLKLLNKLAKTAALDSSNKGLEREALRFTPEARLALSPHPEAYGSALCHPSITTDFSESLLELVTPTFDKSDDLISYLTNLHYFIHKNLPEGENLWSNSMPCDLQDDIPIAEYGSSGAGEFRKVYRRGLSYRYGKKMQAIAGLHYNFSPSTDFWNELAKVNDTKNDKDFRSKHYFSLLRNFRSLNWFLNYLFGASPAFHESFSELVNSELKEKIGDETYCMPQAVSVRMSDAGYTTSRQGNLNISVNNVEEYTEGLQKAVSEPDAQWANISQKDTHGFTQLSSNFLQAEFEYYSTIRPKPNPKNPRRPLVALKQDGVEYIEVRTLDINPFEPLGICKAQIDFMEVFLYYLLSKNSPLENDKSRECARENLMTVTLQGRQENLRLRCPQNNEFDLTKACSKIFTNLKKVAKILDHSRQTSDFSTAITFVEQRLNKHELLPSHKLMQALKDQSFLAYTKELSQQHQQTLLDFVPDEQLQNDFAQSSRKSLIDQQKVEREGPDYQQFLSNFLRMD
ncbi:glutamate--cysteine ligase [Lentisphaera profundi]|uniref:Glutamate--cysteine ligase n=1 Tax=Lentisphaera profundi TaxID=1658616 RepID=A0ABY7VQB0_9BACT|nr:glutamate--cysteine ligase [Lentisphaera profundi]WDE95902.1 glutamate--cysteine ligase [Lentisphaera profundi]